MGAALDSELPSEETNGSITPNSLICVMDLLTTRHCGRHFQSKQRRVSINSGSKNFKLSREDKNINDYIAKIESQLDTEIQAQAPCERPRGLGSSGDKEATTKSSVCPGGKKVGTGVDVCECWEKSVPLGRENPGYIVKYEYDFNSQRGTCQEVDVKLEKVRLH